MFKNQGNAASADAIKNSFARIQTTARAITTNTTGDRSIVWHYAPWEYLPKIVLSGVLKGSNAGCPSELPLLWFSTNPLWEPTASKFVSKFSDGTGLMRLTFESQAEILG